MKTFNTKWLVYMIIFQACIAFPLDVISQDQYLENRESDLTEAVTLEQWQDLSTTEKSTVN